MGAVVKPVHSQIIFCSTSVARKDMSKRCWTELSSLSMGLLYFVLQLMLPRQG